MLRNPVLWLGLAVTGWMVTLIEKGVEDWASGAYQGVPLVSAPLLLAISLVVAVSFHRERVGLAPDSPVGETARATARLLAAAPLVALGALVALAITVKERSLGGLSLGNEPGRTLEALHSTAELSQHVALAFLAVAFGAALGRRVPHLVGVVPLVFVSWFAISVYWMFNHHLTTPLSILQVQPIYLEAGPGDTNPLELPSHWLLEAPSDYSEIWSRLFVSAELAWWHDLWLVGLGLLWLAAVVPGARRRLLVAGVLLAVTGALGGYAVIP